MLAPQRHEHHIATACKLLAKLVRASREMNDQMTKSYFSDYCCFLLALLWLSAVVALISLSL